MRQKTTKTPHNKMCKRKKAGKFVILASLLFILFAGTIFAFDARPAKAWGYYDEYGNYWEYPDWGYYDPWTNAYYGYDAWGYYDWYLGYWVPYTWGGVPDDAVFVPTYFDVAVDKAAVKTPQANLPVPWIGQEPELPTGCEITALATDLAYLGYPIDKVDLATQYFTNPEESPDFRNYYIGDPATYQGLGCYAPAVVRAANAFLSTQSTQLYAFDCTSYTFEELLNQVAAGHPVMIWTTQEQLDPYYGIRVEVDGKTIQWICQEHCVVMHGYDLNRDVVLICDPLDGDIELDINLFKTRYIQLRYNAVIIKTREEKFAEDVQIQHGLFSDRFLPSDKYVRGCKGFDGVLEAD